MGFGDEIMGSGFARGAADRGKRIAFGDGRQIIWHENARSIFAGNPNVAPPGTEWLRDLEWIRHYPGNRVYCQMSHNGGRRRWLFKPNLVVPGEIILTDEEKAAAASLDPDGDLILIEPNTKNQAPNKRWGHERYAQIARLLSAKGYRVAQFAAGGMALDHVHQIRPPNFRVACALLQRARLYVGPEGGLHHAAAALGTKAVVIFGGYIAPAVTGYSTHANLFSGEALGCGYVDPCNHCRQCMARITVDQVAHHAFACLEAK